ncbi:MAG: methyltransferase domain-containing protein [Candidatus Desulfofervidaceae bacterium]|nr:methyltransferase domain-containing protein [Candidatus Desulfofervidaceae bacterium]MDL1969574.1 methyltransferase domain-containing protein [Candidatus Desulfofervidaceae bacterium]
MDSVAYFNKIASDYDAWYLTPIGSYVDTTEKEQVFSLWQTKQGRVLDLGCGTGNYTVTLATQEISVIGLDKSLSMLKLARRKLPYTPLVKSDAAYLPFKDKTFAGVISITLFEFLFYPENAIREIYRVLKPGGEVLIGTMNTLSPWFGCKRLKSLFVETAYRYARFYTPRKLKSLLSQEGFINIETRGVIYLPSFIPSFLIPLARRLDKKLSASAWRHIAAFILVRGERP